MLYSCAVIFGLTYFLIAFYLLSPVTLLLAKHHLFKIALQAPMSKYVFEGIGKISWKSP